ncbi:MAG: hypothetical protein QM796_17275 [Chthoniobacteraceae bacterium]
MSWLPRDEYRITELGRDFRPVMLSLLAWGNKHFAPEGPSLQIVHRQTGQVAEPTLVDGRTGQPLNASDYECVPGPGADDRIRKRYAKATLLEEQKS